MAMELDHSFTVPVPPDRAWYLLLDVARIGPCIPGATIDEIDGDLVSGRIKVKVGPVSLTYRGTAKIIERDPHGLVVVVEASGKEIRGAGTASATVRASLVQDISGNGTKVNLHTTMNVTGRPAQFGRGVLMEVGGKLVEQFAANLSGLTVEYPVATGNWPHIDPGPEWRSRLVLPLPGDAGLARRAVSIGVERFRDPYERLAFVPGLVGGLSEALSTLGYQTTARPEAELASAGLGAAIRDNLEWPDSDGVLIVHVLTHGHLADGNASVYVLGSDGTVHADADIAHWLTSLQNTGDRPMTLFLLDLCQAGTVARLPWQALAEGQVRGWVIAACRGDRPAYDGRFTRAVTNVLHSLAAGELDIDPAIKHVPMDTVARAIRREVNRLSAAEDAYPQQVTATMIDISAGLPDLPFFPNPAHRDDPTSQLRAGLEPALVPFLDDLDEGLDARHFVERAAGAGPLPETPEDLRGCFTGRARELRRLSPWLSGEGEVPLHVVTGSPGVGKSALLGVLVCAAHPLLREQTRPIWSRIAQRPLMIPDLAAVHSRRRGVAAVMQSLAGQLRLADPQTPADLVDAITRMPQRPVIVVDALDEADDGVQLMSELLLPLAGARRDGGGPAARLLIGVRRYDEYASLLRSAETAGGLVDLDDVPANVLEDDLYQYVTELLRADGRYRRSGGVVGAFAGEVARVLSEQAADSREWGEFLVAGLYTRHLLTTRPDPPADPAEATRIGARVPRTLPDVLELDLTASLAGPVLRQVIITVAHARGQGMPLTVLTRLLDGPAFASTEQVQWALHAGRFYLRQSTDSDGSTLYRLFHQGLTDHLSQHPVPHLLANLLAALGPAGARNWQAAEPYVLRHALEHAEESGEAPAVLQDPGFLMQPDSDLMVRALTGALGEVYRASLDTSMRPPQVNRAALALNAARAGMSDLAEAVATWSGEPPLTWQPRWTAGKPRNTPRVVDNAIIVSGDSEGTVQVWQMSTQQPISEPMTGHQGPVDNLTVTELDGRPVAVTGGGDGTVRLWDLAAQQPIGEPMTGHQGPVDNLTVTELDGRPVAVTAGGDGTVRLWDLAAQQPIGQPMTDHKGSVYSLTVTELDGRPSAVTAELEGTVRLWDLITQQAIGPSMDGHQGATVGLTVTELDGCPVAVTGGGDGTVRLWDLATQQPIGQPMTGHKGWVHTLSAGQLNGHPVAVTGGDDGTVRLWDLANQQAIGPSMDGHQGATVGLTVTELDGRPVAATGGEDGTVRLWDLTTHQPIGQPMTGHQGPIVNLTVMKPDGRPVAVTGGLDGTVRLWDLTTQQPIGQPMIRHSGPVVVSVAVGPVAARDDEVPAWISPGMAGGALSKDVVAIRSLAVTEFPSGRAVVLGDDRGRVSVVELGSGKPCLEVPEREGPAVTGIKCGRIADRPVAVLALGQHDRWILDLTNGQTITTGETADPLQVGHVPQISSFIVAGGFLLRVQGTPDGTVTMQDGSSTTWLGQHRGRVTALVCAYLNDRPVAFSGGQDGTVRVWDLLDRQLLEIIGVPGPVFAIHATADGDLVIGADGEAIVFRYAGIPG